MFKKGTHILLFIVASIILYAAFIAYRLFQETQPPHDFITVFTSVSWPKGKDVSAEAERYVLHCCKESDEAIDLLEKTGFNLKYIDDPDAVKRQNRSLDQWRRSVLDADQFDYDAFAFGHRWTGWRFWRLSTAYRVTLYIKNNSVVRVHAVVDTTLP